MEELKVRIKNYEKLRSRLEKLGATKEKEENVRDTYFKGQGKNALKIHKNSHEGRLRKYKKKDKGFKLVKDEKLEDTGQKRDELAEKYGIEADQKKQQIFLELEGKTVILNSIQNLGDFLVVQSEKVEKKFIEEKIGIEDPEYIEVPFSDL